nr:hypothetical protein [Tanacetum cinerariifolium]
NAATINYFTLQNVEIILRLNGVVYFSPHNSPLTMITSIPSLQTCARLGLVRVKFSPSVKDGGAVHDGVFQVNPLECVHFDNRVLDDVSFDGMSIKDFLATIRSHVDSDSYGETNVPLDDIAHVVEQFEHENEGNVNIPRMTTDEPWLNKLNDHNKLLVFCGRDVSEGKCVGLKGKKPKTVDDDECETS